MKTKITFSATLINLTPAQLESVLSKFEISGEPEMRVAKVRSTHKEARSPQPRKGNHRVRTSPNALHQLTGKAPKSNGKTLLAYQCLKKYSGNLLSTPFKPMDAKRLLVSQKVFDSLVKASPYISALRKEGVLEIVE